MVALYIKQAWVCFLDDKILSSLQVKEQFGEKNDEKSKTLV